jgi:hypothetical protein
MIVLQEDGRYVEIVEFEGKNGESAIAVVEIGENKNIEYMNGYQGGKYQVLVTTLNPDDGYIEDLRNKKAIK